MSREPIHIIGASGHAKVVIATILVGGGSVAGLYDDDPSKWGQSVLDHPIVGPSSAVPPGARAIIAIGSNRVRRDIGCRLAAQGVELATAVHPTACVHPSVKLGGGSVVFAAATIQPDARIGAHVIVNTNASVDHDCVLGDFVHVAPGVALAGNVTLEEGAFLGIGAVAVPGSRVGAWATVGAGGVVVQPIAAGVTAVGAPARPLARAKTVSA